MSFLAIDALETAINDLRLSDEPSRTPMSSLDPDLGGSLAADMEDSKPDLTVTEQTGTPDVPTATIPTSTALPITSPVQSDKITLECSDGERIITSQALLIKHSTFFADILSLPFLPDSSRAHPEQVIPLPSATSLGLNMVLAALRSLERSPDAPLASLVAEYWLEITTADLRFIVEGMTCADAYDLTEPFKEAFIMPVWARLHHQPMIAYAIAAIADMPSQASHSARHSIQSLGTERPTIPLEIHFVLETHAPDYLQRLSAWYRQRPAALHVLRKGMRTHAEMPDGQANDYGLRCKGQKTGYAPCAAFRYRKKWKTLRAEAAEAVVAALPTQKLDMMHLDVLREVVSDVVQCGKCCNRLAYAFRPAVVAYFSACRYDNL